MKLLNKYSLFSGLIVSALATTAATLGLTRTGGQEPNATPPAAKPQSTVRAESSFQPLAQQLDPLKAEYETALRTFMGFYRGSTIPPESLAQATKLQPDYPAFVRRIATLAASALRSPAVRDAMLWVIGQSPHGPYAAEFALAANWLVRYFGDDPDAIRVGLDLDNLPNPYRDNLLLTFYASAKSRESKGLARLALA